MYKYVNNTFFDRFHVCVCQVDFFRHLIGSSNDDKKIKRQLVIGPFLVFEQEGGRGID